ncbi:MAG: hydrogen gas-evolving membrane-bound hydrogenase subunit E [Ketobacteraceae bacterium]|nr:hydrogen gas-evolving membrane-bound hydrogenase subunit E [Ketobacteraceae bacterium]
MMEWGTAVNLLMAALVVLFAALALLTRDLFKASIFFICFGLLMSLCWVRLGAIDVAIAEAIIGAGITGALCLIALKSLPTHAEPGKDRRHPAFRLSKGAVMMVLTTPFVALLSYFIVLEFSQSGGLYTLTQGSLAQTGVTNPVTAVLVNYRGYDTLLELAVLILALMVIKSSRDPSHLPPEVIAAPVNTPLLRSLVTFVVPLSIMIAGYLLWIGSTQPGGAFQAGALLASAGLLVRLSRRDLDHWLLRDVLSVPVTLGWLVFGGVAVGMLFAEGQLLRYPVSQAGGWILLIEFFATLSISVLLLQLLNEHIHSPGGKKH